jgi:hypothetical protein
MPNVSTSQTGGNQNSKAEQDANLRPDPAAPAGSPSSVGAESVRDGRPSSCDDVVEAMDEAGPGPK